MVSVIIKIQLSQIVYLSYFPALDSIVKVKTKVKNLVKTTKFGFVVLKRKKTIGVAGRNGLHAQKVVGVVKL